MRLKNKHYLIWQCFCHHWARPDSTHRRLIDPPQFKEKNRAQTDISGNGSQWDEKLAETEVNEIKKQYLIWQCFRHHWAQPDSIHRRQWCLQLSWVDVQVLLPVQTGMLLELFFGQICRFEHHGLKFKKINNENQQERRNFLETFVPWSQAYKLAI